MNAAACLLARLGVATLVFTLLAGLMVAARRPLRRRLGAEAAYALWLLVPLGVALSCWPVHREWVRVQAAAIAPLASFEMAPTLAPAPSASLLPGIVLAVWLLGATASMLLLWRRQRAFVRMLGPLRRVEAGVWTSERSDAGPLLVGLLRPRIVLPADFAVRYTAPEGAAVLAHERMHRRRGDLWWNAACALLRCAFWFHPLAAPAQRRYLADQELACDSAVLRRSGSAPRVYAEALLKTQAGAGVPLGCGMAAASPLAERILNLGRRGASRRARAAVALALAALALGGARLAWAATRDAVAVADTPGPAAAPGPAFRVALDLAVDGGAARHQERIVRGPLHLDGLRDGDGRSCGADVFLAGLANGAIGIRLHLDCAGRRGAGPGHDPGLIVQPGVPATVAIGTTERRPDGSYVTTRGFRLTIRADRA